MLATMITGIAVFALLFAVNSSIHSYLVVRYAEGNKVAQSVGFYYMSNAAGRLMGTLVSGALYTYVGNDVNQGIGACFFAGTVSCFLGTIITFKINDDKAGLRCGSCLTIVDGEFEEADGPPPGHE
mmetsp:Transcript_96273/g.144147  ORF Transcript_96273/g.144147 Transcript_96273/m.144147 type:complete len:126 (+) Transcript_96273:2-379(+)